MLFVQSCLERPVLLPCCCWPSIMHFPSRPRGSQCFRCVSSDTFRQVPWSEADRDWRGPTSNFSKAILWILSSDIQDTACPLQVCAGQVGGCEAAVHAMRLIFNEQDIEGALLIEAENAFNSINRTAALHNIHILCPPFSRVLINSYRNPLRMVIPGSGEIMSCEGTTQGDPLAMSMYALAITPLIRELSECRSDTKQVWYTDDATSAGTCLNLKKWWDRLTSIGPKYGYFPKSSKCLLVVKPGFEGSAKSIFEGMNIHITTGGTRHLGAAIGSKEYREDYVATKVKTWIEEIHVLTDIASTSLMPSTQHSCMLLRADGRLSPEQYQMFRVCLNRLRMRSINYSYLHSQAVLPAQKLKETSLLYLQDSVVWEF